MAAVLDFEAALSAKAEQEFRDRWSNGWSASDLAEPLPPIPWVCEALAMAPGAVTIVGGAGFGGKTISMQAFLLAVASGRKAWNQHDVAYGRAMHIDFEQGRYLTQWRYQRLARSMRIDLRELDGRLRGHCLPKARLDDNDACENDLVRLLDGVKIAIVDAFRGAFPTANENESGVRRFLDMLQNVSDRTGCTIVVIAHSKKMNDDVDIRSSLRGSGALFDAAQTVYMIDGVSREMRRVTGTKDRWLGELHEPFGLRVKDEVGTDGDRKWGLIVEYAAPCEVQAEEMAREDNIDLTIAMNVARLSSIGERIIPIIANHPTGLTLSTLSSVLRGAVPVDAIRAVLSQLIADGAVFQDGGGHTAVYRWVR